MSGAVDKERMEAMKDYLLIAGERAFLVSAAILIHTVVSHFMRRRLARRWARRNASILTSVSGGYFNKNGEDEDIRVTFVPGSLRYEAEGAPGRRWVIDAIDEVDLERPIRPLAIEAMLRPVRKKGEDDVT